MRQNGSFVDPNPLRKFEGRRRKKISFTSFLKCFCLDFLDSPVFILKASQRQRYEEEVGSCFEEGRIHCRPVTRLHHIAKLTSVDLQKGSPRKKLCKQSSFRAFSSFKLSLATLCKYGSCV